MNSSAFLMLAISEGVILAALAVELLPALGKAHALKEVVLGGFLPFWGIQLMGR